MFSCSLSQLVQAHWTDLQDAHNSHAAAVAALSRDLSDARLLAERATLELAASNNASNAKLTATEAQLKDYQAKLARAMKKIRFMVAQHQASSAAAAFLPNESAMDGDDASFSTIDTSDTLIKNLTSENEKLMYRLSEIQKQREIERTTYNRIISDLQRENSILTERISNVEGKWLQSVLEVVGAVKDGVFAAVGPVTIDPKRQAIVNPDLPKNSTILEKDNSIVNLQMSFAENIPVTLKRPIFQDETQLPCVNDQNQSHLIKKVKTAVNLDGLRQGDVDYGKKAAPEDDSRSQKSLLSEPLKILQNYRPEKAVPKVPLGTAMATASERSKKFVSPASRTTENPKTTEKDIYKYQEVVRSKEERRKLHGTSCPCCSEFFDAVGYVPPILELGQLAPPSSVNSHLQNISRHRTKFEPPSTPVGYWDVGFPTTQELDERKSRK